MKKTISIILSIAMLLSCFNVLAFAEEDAEGNLIMEDGYAVRVTKLSSEVEKVHVGDIIQVEFWTKNLDPVMLVLPVKWNPEVLQVVKSEEDPQPVENGYKDAEMYRMKQTGFNINKSLYDTSYDGRYPNYWNGRMMYSDSYPYLNNDTGLYKMAFTTLSPIKGRKAQLFLTLTMKVVGLGDADIHFATEDDVPADATEETRGEYMDETCDMGIAVLPPIEGQEHHEQVSGDDMKSDEVIVYTDKVTMPELTAVTPGSGGVGGGTVRPTSSATATASPSPSGSPTVVDTLKDKPSMNMPELKNPQVLKASIVADEENKITSDCYYQITEAELAQVVSDWSQTKAGAVVIDMPDKLLSREDYPIKIGLGTFDELARFCGINTVYVKSPFGVVGVGTGTIQKAISGTEPVLTLTLSKGKTGETGINIKADINGIGKGEFGARVFRVYIPAGELGEKAADMVPYTTDMEGSQRVISMSKYDPETKFMMFTASATGEYTLKEATAPAFADMENALWAKDAVDALAKKGIVNGVNETEFNPDGLVTREEFAKMLVGVFGIEQTGASTTFQDTDSSAWYYSSVASAQAAKVINGVSGTEFGIGQNITREDMATMVCRASEVTGLTLPEVNEKAEFQDAGQIADYAAGFVTKLQTAGIINGKDEGNFDPKGSATRAEAAKVMAALFEMMIDLL